MAQRFEGKNLDEALTMASEAFGVDRVQLTYHVVLEKKGFLGGIKRIVVEAEVNERPPFAQGSQSPFVAENVRPWSCSPTIRWTHGRVDRPRRLSMRG